MKHINIPLDDETYQELTEVKGDRSWQQALVDEFGIDE
jgi:predicted CopG family antitoxin